MPNMPSSFSTHAIPDLSGKVILITGGELFHDSALATHTTLTLVDPGNAGLGKEAALQFAKHNPSRIFIASRTEEKARKAIAEIVAVVPTAHITPIQLDLASLASVAAAAKAVMSMTSRLDILMNNAGIMAVPPQLSADGYEIQFATNFLGHALLTKLLLPLLLTTAREPAADVRIITLTSHSHQRAPKSGILFDALRSANGASTPLANYAQTKLANILYSKQLAQRYSSIKAVAVHPGMVNTGLSTTMKESFLLARLVMPIVALWQGVAVEKGVLNQLWAATSRDAQSGEYYEPVGVGGLGSALSNDAKLGNKLWVWTADELASFTPEARL